ncbi:TerB family tellurite resistance protein [Variovorax sp. RA8]|uniref:TerB family tellurite resistance protein n=1 Tax=Variovorax sp. (strain JCM 16519 / RA8) TaxID=662548 RepID=UPI0013186FE4|nr:TerB family tellurite resistance protein [Variovorax sp. RA8]VTU16240.1 hypothetical protein RA8CHR_01219 [Variovorax sp. RA8]
MRRYERDSAEAATRVVVMAMLADGHLSRCEIEAFAHADAHRQLGLDSAQLRDLISDFCDDILQAAPGDWAQACRSGTESLSAMLREIECPTLRRKVLRICKKVIEADAHLADGEATVLAEMFAQWGIDARAKHAATPAAQNLSMPARKENRHAQLQH